MFMTNTAITLSQLLATHYVKDSPIDEMDLLKAYATYKAKDDEGFIRLLQDDFFKFSPNGLPSDLSSRFICYSLDKFIATIIPNVVGDCLKVARLIEEEKLSTTGWAQYETSYDSRKTADCIGICFAIFHIKEKFSSLFSDSQPDNNSDTDQESIDKEWLFESYTEESKNRKIPYITELVHFNTLAESTLLLRQDNSMKILNLSSYDKPFEAIRYGYNTFGMTRTDMTWFLAEGHALAVSGHVRESKLSKIKKEEEKKALKADIFDALKGLPSPAEALALAENTKRRSADKKSNDEGKSLRPTDAPIELSLVFNTFAAEASSMRQQNDSCLIIFPSALFVMKWADNKFLANKKAKFVIMSEPALELLASTYSSNSLYRDNTSSNMQFVLYDDWKESISESEHLKETFILYFENHTNDYKWIGKDSNAEPFLSSLHKKLDPKSTIYCLSPESYLNNTSSLLYQCTVNDKEKPAITEAAAIPRKGPTENMLFDNTTPSQKLFWKACYSKDWDGNTRITFLRNDSKALALLGKLEDRWKGNGRMLTLEQAKQVSISLQAKAKNFRDWTLRQFCFNQKKDVYPRKQARNEVKFSDEISFWYTISVAHNYRTGKKTGSMMKLEVVARHITRQDYDKSSGVRGTGKNNVIQGSLADFYISPTKAADKEYVEKYILSNYPKKKFYRRAEAEEENESNQRYMVKRYPREEISKVYREELAGQDLTIRTLLFIHEELDTVIVPGTRGRSPTLLHDILYPIIDAHCSALTVEDFVRAIQATMPDRSTAGYINALYAIRKLMSTALGTDPNKPTPIDKLIDDEEEFSKAMSKLRSALGKKHFSFDEFVRLYDEVVKRIQTSPIYYGVLIRLFTGLESNIVASLCWNDYKHNAEYDFHYLTIYRQVPGNGSKDIALRADSNIRRLPLSKTLVKHLEAIRPRRKRRGSAEEIYNPDVEESDDSDNYEDIYSLESDENENTNEKSAATILSTAKMHIVRSSKNSTGEEAVSPHKLDEKTKEVLNDVFGDDDYLSFLIPCDSNDEGFEQSLARYRGGLIFRENLRYWLTRYCRLDVDQVSHYLGNSGATTLGRYYLDSNSTPNQYLVASKIWRFDALLEEHIKGCTYKRQEELKAECNKKLTIEGKGTKPIDIDLNITSINDSAPCQIKVRCTHDLSVYTQTITVEDKLDE